MRFYCVELKKNFDSVKLANIFAALGLTVLKISTQVSRW